MDPPIEAAKSPNVAVAVDSGFCFPQVPLYFRKSHHASHAMPPPNESWCLIRIPWHDIRQLHPTLAVAAGEISSLVEVVRVGQRSLLPLAGHHHPAMRDRVARPVDVDASVDMTGILHARLVSNPKADCQANT